MIKINGVVKFYNEKKGYGFIKGDNNKDYFFHNSNVLNLETLTKEDIVSFVDEKSNKGLQAKEICKI